MTVHLRSVRVYFLLGLFIFSTISWSHALWIHAKAHLAQYLITDAWEQTLKAGKNTRPWHWADTWPVAKMNVPEHNITLYVLAGSHGSSLAFGPGHMDGTALPDEDGTHVISGHRDTHFAFLKYVNVGTEIDIQNKNGQWRRYEITDSQIKNSEDGPWHIDQTRNELHLITCYPFNAINPGGPLRYVAIAKEKVSEFHADQASLDLLNRATF